MQKDQLQNGATHHSSLFFVLPSLSRRKITRINYNLPESDCNCYNIYITVLLYSAYQAYSINSINTAKGRFSPRVRTEGDSNKIVR